MKILLLGANGMLGSDFQKVLSQKYDLSLFSYDHKTLDISNFIELEKAFSEIKPDLVINCAAYTAVDDCENNQELAFLLNAQSPAEIARLCELHGSKLVHFSTDYVFDGKKVDGYLEDDKTGNPLNIYGASKLKGEELIMANMRDFYIVRTSWLFGENGVNFVSTILELSKKKESLSIVNDQRGCPTYTKDLANKVVECFIDNAFAPGVFHLVNDGECSWFDFAKIFLEMAGTKIEINAVGSKTFPRPAKRPNNSILLNTKLPKMRGFEEAVKAYIDVLLA